ncbi:MAG: CBS domain-containing protein [Rubripirellula sp.]
MHEMFDRIVSLRVLDVMTSDPITVDASLSMEDVSQLFGEQGIHSAPVVDNSGKCVGIITASDFVKRNRKYSSSDSQPHELSHHEEGILLEPRSYDYVSDCMTDGIQSITPTMPLIAAARIMTDAHIHTLPVIEGHQPVGVLSNLDVVAALVNAFEEARNSI